MARTPLFQRLPKIFHRLDDDVDSSGKGVFQRFLEVLDSSFDLVLAKAKSLLDTRSVDKIADKYLQLMADLVGHIYRSDRTKAWNRRRIRTAIDRHSYKGTLTCLGDIVADNGASQFDVIDQASKLLVWGSQGSWGYDDCALVAADYWHDGAMLLQVSDNVDLPNLKIDLTDFCPGGERWYLILLSDFVVNVSNFLGMSDQTITMDRTDITMDMTALSDADITDRKARALFYRNQGLWVAIGRTTPWTDEESPESLTTLTEPVLYARVFDTSLVEPADTRPTPEDGVQVGSNYYGFVPDSSSTDLLCCDATVDPADGVPQRTFRQSALFLGLAPMDAYKNANWLLPSQVSNAGNLQAVFNHPPKTISTDIRRLRFLLDF